MCVCVCVCTQSFSCTTALPSCISALLFAPTDCLFFFSSSETCCLRLLCLSPPCCRPEACASLTTMFAVASNLFTPASLNKTEQRALVRLQSMFLVLGLGTVTTGCSTLFAFQHGGCELSVPFSRTYFTVLTSPCAFTVTVSFALLVQHLESHLSHRHCAGWAAYLMRTMLMSRNTNITLVLLVVTLTSLFHTVTVPITQACSL